MKYLRKLWVYIISLTIFLSLSLFTLRGIIVTPGTVEYRDLIWPQNLSELSEKLFYLTDFDWTKRIIYLGPIIWLSSSLGIESSIVEKTLFVSFRTLTEFSMFFVTYKTFQKTKLSKRTLFFLSIFAGVAYTLMPSATMMVAPTLAFQFSYSVLPFTFYYFNDAITRNKFKSCILASIFLTLTIAGTIQYLVLLPILIGLWLFLNIMLEIKDKKKILKIIKSFLAILLLSTLFSSYWIAPALFILNKGSTLSPSYVLTYEMLDVFSKNSNILNALRLMADWWPRVPLVPLEFIPNNIWTLLTFILPLFVFLSLIFSLEKKKEHKCILFTAIITLIFLFLYKGTREPFGSIYQLLYGIPVVGWMFRVPSKIGMVLAFLYTILLSFTVYKILAWKIRAVLKCIILFFILGSLAVINWPAFTGDFGGVLKSEVKEVDNNREIPNISIPVSNFLVLDEFSKELALDFISSNHSSIFIDQVLWNKKQFCSDVGNLVFDGEYLNLLFVVAHLNSPNIQIIDPFSSTYHHNPSILWSKASTSDPLHGDWHPYLKKFGIENSDFDYGKGLLFTWASSKLKESLTPNNNDLINYWTFNSIDDLNQWKAYTSENQFGALYTITLDDGSLKAELWNSTWGWKTIDSPLIEVEYGNWYRWQFQIKADNAHDVHIKIAEYDQNRKVITEKYAKSIGSGTFNWQTVTIDYTPENPETRYIQLQIWHGHETTQQLPNRIWIDDVKIYDLKRFVEPVALEIPFTIKENGEYVFLTRLFQNQRGGKIQIQLDNRNYIINTKDQLNKFVWKEIDTIYLEKGSHKITLINLKGFNAVNLFALIPKHEYQNAQKQIEDILRDKRIIYILEAETDLYYQNSTVSNKYDGEASNGQTLTLNQTSKAYNTIEILKTGNYTFAIRSKGNLTIKIDEKEYKISTIQLNWTYIGPLYLEKGNHTIEITNPIQPQYEWNFNSADDLYLWKNYTRENQFGSLYTLTLDNGALKAELWNSTWGWKTINSPLIPVTPEDTYQFDFYVAGENAHSVHVKIAEYDLNKTLLSTKIMTNIGSGNFTRKNINFKYTPSQKASYIQLQIWHGHETTQPLPNKIWIDNVRVNKYYEPSELDVVWLYSTQNPHETLADILTPKENPAEIISYRKIDPTKYVVKVNATRPFMLSFAKSYDPLWVAYVNGEKIQSIPLYGVINGFWINQTGLLEITIEYEPQKWFHYGLAISLLTLTGCILYLTKEPLYRLASKIRKLKLTL